MRRACRHMLLPVLLLAMLFGLEGTSLARGQPEMTGDAASKSSRVEFLGVCFGSTSDPTTTGDAGRATVKISGQCEYYAFLLPDPPRLVLDLTEVKFGGAPEKREVGRGVVKSVRISQFDKDTTRVVFDLAYEAGFTVSEAKATGEGASRELSISFNSIVTGVRAGLEDGRFMVRVAGVGLPTRLPGSNPAGPSGSDGKPDAGRGINAFALSGPDRIVVDLPQATLARDAVRDVPVSDDIVKRIRLSQFDAATVRMVLDLRSAQQYRLAASGDGGVILDLGYRLKRLEFNSGPDGTEVEFGLSGDAPLSVKKVDGENLIAVEVENTVWSGGERVIPVNDGVISSVRVEEPEPFKVRVLLELPYYVRHEVQPGEGPIKTITVTRSPLYDKILVVDPGHGGTDPGAISPTGLQEKAVVLDIGVQLAELLARAGASVTLTRKDDTYVTLSDRVDLANRLCANAFVSIHANSVSELHPSGTETFYFEAVQGSKTLADAIHEALVSGIGLIDRRAKARELYVLKWTKMPSCLVEVAFLSNVTEEQLLMDPAFRSKVAKSLFDGLWNFFKQGVPEGSGDRKGPPGLQGPASSPDPSNPPEGRVE